MKSGLEQDPEAERSNIGLYQRMEPTISLGARDISPGKLYKPRGLALDESDSLIYIAEGNGISRVSIFTCNGNFVTTFSHREMVCPWGIGVQKDSIYVSDLDADIVFHYGYDEGCCHGSKVCIRGSGEGQFIGPTQMAISSEGNVYISDELNHRIQVMDCNLRYLHSISHTSLTSPVDVKLKTYKLFVLSCEDKQCVHVFSYEGELLNSLISQGFEGLVYGANFFQVDAEDNILISDWGAHQIKIFSDDGVLQHTIGSKGEQFGMFRFTFGLALTQDFKLITVSLNNNHALQIFST